MGGHLPCCDLRSVYDLGLYPGPDPHGARRCAASARERGARVGVTTTTGDHGDSSDYDAEGILRLFESVDE